MPKEPIRWKKLVALMNSTGVGNSFTKEQLVEIQPNPNISILSYYRNMLKKMRYLEGNIVLKPIPPNWTFQDVFKDHQKQKRHERES